MRTVTLQIIESPADHTLSDPAKAGRRYKRGDILDAMLTPPNATKTGNDWHWDQPLNSPRTVLVHMRDVPDDRWHNMRNVFSAEMTAGEELTRRRKWRFLIPNLATPKRNELLTNREVTLAWTAARDHIRRKVVTTQTDPDGDDESNAVLDADLPGP